MKFIERVGTVPHMVNAAKCDAPDPSLYEIDKSKYHEGGFKNGLNRAARRGKLNMKSYNFSRKSIHGKMNKLTENVIREGILRGMLEQHESEAEAK